MRVRLLIAALLGGVLVSVMWTRYTGARWYPARMWAVREMLRLGRVGPEDTLYDLGSGDGRILLAAASRHGARAIGIEIDPLRSAISRALASALGLGERVTVRRQNLFSADIHDATVVTCFLLPDTNRRLEPTLIERVRPGTRVVSWFHTFPTLPLVREDSARRIYVYEVPARA